MASRATATTAIEFKLRATTSSGKTSTDGADHKDQTPGNDSFPNENSHLAAKQVTDTENGQ